MNCDSALFDLSSNATTEEIVDACNSALNDASTQPPPALQNTAQQVARILVDKNAVSVLVQLKIEQNRNAVRDQLLQLLLRQMTNQAPPSALQTQSNLPPGVQHMATLISLNAVSLRGTAITIKKLLDAPQFRRTALSLLAKVAEGCATERRNSSTQSSSSSGSSSSSSSNKQVSAIATAMESLKETVQEFANNDPSLAYECFFIMRCFGWMPQPTINVVQQSALCLVRRSHRVPCYSVLAMQQPHNNLSLVATCSRDTRTIDVFRDVGVNNDYALSSFAVPPAFTPLSLVSSSPTSAVVALCCGVEVSERVGLGIVPLGDASASAQCDVREVFGVSQPTCAVSMAINGPNAPTSPIVAVGCAVPGGFGVTTVVVETTQRIHTISDSHRDTVTCLASYGDSVVISASRDGSVELWDLRRSPRGPAQSILSANVGKGDATSAMTLIPPSANDIASTGTDSSFSQQATASGPLLVTGGIDGLLRVWDLRAPAVQHGGGVDSSMVSRVLDGPITSLAALPQSSSSNATTKAKNDSNTSAASENNSSSAGTSSNNNSVHLAVSSTRTLNMLRLDYGSSSSSTTNNNNNSTGGSFFVEQIVPCRSTTNSQGEFIPETFHDLCVAPNFAGTSNTYILAGSELGVCEAFKVREF